MHIDTQPDAAATAAMLGAPSLQLNSLSWSAAGNLTKWIGKNAASGIVGAAAGMLFQEFLGAVGMGGPDLAGKLDIISDKLTEVQRSLDRVESMTSEILLKLDELHNFMEKSLKVETLLTAMGRIDVAYGYADADASLLKADATGGAISLRLLTENMPHFPGMTPEYLMKAAHEFASYVADVPDCIDTIRRVLAKAAFGQDSLLDHWAKELAQQVRNKKISRESAYLVIEGYFLQAISVQLKGLCVHCLALSTDQFAANRIEQYLQQNFGLLMREQTEAYTAAVEDFIFLSLDPIMRAGMTDMSAREFPVHVDEILLRTDLLCAALNLVGRKSTGPLAASPQAAIQGMYARSLFRPSDLRDGKVPPMDVSGYAPAQAGQQRQAPFACLDLIASDDRAVLRDVATTRVTVARYKWHFPTTAPAVGVSIDSRFRGATPALYPVFGPDEPVLAVGIFNGSPLFRGVPASVQQSRKYTPFPKGNPHVTYFSETHTPGRHPLTNGKGEVTETFFQVQNAYKADSREHSLVMQHLFSYTGQEIDVRMHVQVLTRLQVGPRVDMHLGAGMHNYSVYHRLLVRFPDGTERAIYNSEIDFDHAVDVQRVLDTFNRSVDVARSGFFSMDFKLIPGEYHLILDNETYFPSTSHKYSGWNSANLVFKLGGVALEMRYPTS